MLPLRAIWDGSRGQGRSGGAPRPPRQTSAEEAAGGMAASVAGGAPGRAPAGLSVRSDFSAAAMLGVGVTTQEFVTYFLLIKVPNFGPR
jgi:hypothetical protein